MLHIKDDAHAEFILQRCQELYHQPFEFEDDWGTDADWTLSNLGKYTLMITCRENGEMTLHMTYARHFESLHDDLWRLRMPVFSIDDFITPGSYVHRAIMLDKSFFESYTTYECNQASML